MWYVYVMCVCVCVWCDVYQREEELKSLLMKVKEERVKMMA